MAQILNTCTGFFTTSVEFTALRPEHAHETFRAGLATPEEAHRYTQLFKEKAKQLVDDHHDSSATPLSHSLLIDAYFDLGCLLGQEENLSGALSALRSCLQLQESLKSLGAL